MFFKIFSVLSVLLLGTGISCSHHILHTAPIQENIAAPIVSSVPISDFHLPQSIPQFLLNFPQTSNFEIPQSIPVQLLTITAPGVVSQSFPGQPLSVALKTPLVSPAQKFRSQSTPVIAPNAGQSSGISAAIPESASIPNLEPNAFSSSESSENENSSGFSTPFKPLNFAPNLPEVNPKSSPNLTPEQNTPNTGTLTIPQPIQRNLEIKPINNDPQEVSAQQPLSLPKIDSVAQPLNQPRIEALSQPITQQRIESEVRPLTQQRVEVEPPIQQRIEPITQQRIEPITQQRIEPLPQPITQQRIVSPITQLRANRPTFLSSYSF